jgi:6-phosphogluconolactonase/glucosamine-6-phosphate isomerase/deaminase
MWRLGDLAIRRRGAVRSNVANVGESVDGMRKANVIVCGTPADVARAGAARVATWLSAAVSARKRATVSLAGGRTPETLYRVPAETPYRETIDWGGVEIFWGDERCVPPDHPDSNYRMVREALLARVAIPEANIHRMRGETADPAAAARADCQAGPRPRRVAVGPRRRRSSRSTDGLE